MESEDIYRAPEANLDIDPNQEAEFFVVANRKLAILGVGTFGLYYIYFFYKQWVCIKRRHSLSVWPAPRAFFNFFFVHSLSKYVADASQRKNPESTVNLRGFATLYVLVVLGVFVLGFVTAFSGSLVSPSISLAGTVATLVTQALFAGNLQSTVNQVSDDPQGTANERLSAGNILFLLFGLFIWFSNLAGLFLPVPT